MTDGEHGGSHVGFMVVGSPRSGTTLVQRLACEIPGVRVPPETHFFSDYALRLVQRRRFPLDEEALRQEVERFARRPRVQGLRIDVDEVVDDLGGACARPFALFEALVRHLAGPAEVWGEKTPDHLLWWRPVHRAAPEVRFVAVVRDARAVVASNLSMPWRDNLETRRWSGYVHVALAEEWRYFQHQVRSLQRTLGPSRCLVLRYEDVVARPSVARAGIADLIGRPSRSDLQSVTSEIATGSEWWKRDALAEVTTERVSAWRDELGPTRARDVTLVCRSELRRHGYDPELPPRHALAGWGRIVKSSGFPLARSRINRERDQRRINRSSL